MKKRILLTSGIIALAAGMANASLIVDVDAVNSTATHLYLNVSGTVTENDVGNMISFSQLYIYRPGEDWYYFDNAGTGHLVYEAAYGASHTAPLSNGSLNYANGNLFGTAGQQDYIAVSFNNEIQVGDTFDFSFRAWSYNLANWSFEPLLEGAPMTAQVGRDLDVVPEPSVIALMAVFGGGLVAVRRYFPSV